MSVVDFRMEIVQCTWATLTLLPADFLGTREVRPDGDKISGTDGRISTESSDGGGAKAKDAGSYPFFIKPSECVLA